MPRHVASALASTVDLVFVREFIDGAEVDQVLLVRRVERRERRDGQIYLRVDVGDRTGAVRAMVWEDVEAHVELLSEGEPVHVRGRYAVHPSFGPEIKLRELCPPQPGTFAADDLIEKAPQPLEQMERDLRALLDTVHDAHLRALLDRVFAPGSELWARFSVAPAAKHYHQAYAHGLLEHALGVAQAVSAIAATFPGIDREVAVTGALLHDIGKVDAYEARGGVLELSDLGRLHGEIPLGYHRVRTLIEGIPGFPVELERAVLHIILSHHGTLENGSPVVPCTREATLVHMIDNLGGRLGSFDRLERGLQPGRSWSDFDRAIGGSAYFGAPADAHSEEAAEALLGDASAAA
jgi:3'-5' exoribonuclease